VPATPDPVGRGGAAEHLAGSARARPGLPPLLWRYVAVVAVLSCGVASFPLLKPYSDALFTRVEKELDARMQQIAAQTGGTVSGPTTVTAGGIRAHSYEVKAGGTIDEYTFVLRRMREFQLLCRRSASSGDDACKQLLTSFAVA